MGGILLKGIDVWEWTNHDTRGRLYLEQNSSGQWIIKLAGFQYGEFDDNLGISGFKSNYIKDVVFDKPEDAYPFFEREFDDMVNNEYDPAEYGFKFQKKNIKPLVTSSVEKPDYEYGVECKDESGGPYDNPFATALSGINLNTKPEKKKKKKKKKIYTSNYNLDNLDNMDIVGSSHSNKVAKELEIQNDDVMQEKAVVKPQEEVPGNLPVEGLKQEPEEFKPPEYTSLNDMSEDDMFEELTQLDLDLDAILENNPDLGKLVELAEVESQLAELEEELRPVTLRENEINKNFKQIKNKKLKQQRSDELDKLYTKRQDIDTRKGPVRVKINALRRDLKNIDDELKTRYQSMQARYKELSDHLNME